MQPKKILVIQNKRIGDVLIASVLANNLKKVFPDSVITYFVYDYTAGVIENNPNIDRIIKVSDKHLKKPWILLRYALKIRKEGYDLILDPYAKFQSRMICLLSGAPQRVGFKRKGKKLKLPFYTQAVDFLDEASLACGKALEDRISMLQAFVKLPEPDYHYKIFLTEAEKQYAKISAVKKPIVMLGVLGSSPNKSLPLSYVATLVDFIASNHDCTILFNYAPHQRALAEEIYQLCEQQDRINLDLYEDSIRGFIRLMHHCDLLISNEGGSVHIAKALGKPTFTIYSPYIEKSHWNSFEDRQTHDSIHLKEIRPELFSETYSREERKAIEEDPQKLYMELKPSLIVSKLEPYLNHQLKTIAREPHR